jgi:hypothetical protein
MTRFPLSRRTFLHSGLPSLASLAAVGGRLGKVVALLSGASRAKAAASNRRAIHTALEGFRRTAILQRHYSVHATILMLGVPVLVRRDVGGGYASVELGASGGVDAVGLQFSAGAWPQRAAGINRFGVLKEAIIDGESPVVVFAGLVSANRESSLSEARRALNASSSSAEVTVTRGGSLDGRAWDQTENVPVQSPPSWVEAESLLTQLLHREAGVPVRERDTGELASFLCTMHRAALRPEPSRFRFFHSSKLYTLQTTWTDKSSRELAGEIHNASGSKSAEFKASYAPGDSSGLPVHIEYHARSFLKLTFESVSSTDHPAIPSLFPDVRA